MTSSRLEELYQMYRGGVLSQELIDYLNSINKN
jgi:hypothetical protein